MSPDADRIAVPTNGKRPHSVPEPAVPPPTIDKPSTSPAVVAFTPTQLAVGFGIVAAAIALLAGSLRRRSRSRRRGPFDRR